MEGPFKHTHRNVPVAQLSCYGEQGRVQQQNPCRDPAVEMLDLGTAHVVDPKIAGSYSGVQQSREPVGDDEPEKEAPLARHLTARRSAPEHRRSPMPLYA